MRSVVSRIPERENLESTIDGDVFSELWDGPMGSFYGRAWTTAKNGQLVENTLQYVSVSGREGARRKLAEILENVRASAQRISAERST